MSNAQPEPSMEEILASIRRIISEDGEGEGGEIASPPPETKPPQASPVAPAGRGEDLTGPADDLGARTEGLEMMKKNVAEAVQESDDAMIDDTTAAAASKAFEKISQTARVSTGSGKTVEDIVVEMLRPMIKDWLDANLPAIVEEKVEEEVQRLARRRR